MNACERLEGAEGRGGSAFAPTEGSRALEKRRALCAGSPDCGPCLGGDVSWCVIPEERSYSASYGNETVEVMAMKCETKTFPRRSRIALHRSKVLMTLVNGSWDSVYVG